MFHFANYVDDFLDKITDSYLTPRGIMFSEGFALTTAFNELGSKIILESGTAYGGSGEMIAIMCPDKKLITTDMHSMYDSKEHSYNRLSKYQNVKCLDRNSMALFPELLSRNISNVSIFIDGPKGMGALFLVDELLKNYATKISFIGIHDVRYDSPVASLIRDRFDNYLFTDDPQSEFSEFREKIDSHMLEINKQKFDISRSSLDRKEGSGYLQEALQESPNGFGLALIKGPF